MTDSAGEHQRCAKARVQSVRCGVLTVSDSRTEATDRGGPCVAKLLGDAGHEIVERAIVADEADALRARLQAWIADERIEAIVTTGGTGISSRDVTVDVVRDLLSSELEGFGELFRMLSWQQVGAAAMLSRALGGLAGDTLVFALPGSVKAVELAVRELIAPQLSHLVWHRQRGD